MRVHRKPPARQGPIVLLGEVEPVGAAAWRGRLLARVQLASDEVLREVERVLDRG